MGARMFALKWKISTYGDRYSARHNQKVLEAFRVGSEGWRWIIWDEDDPDKRRRKRSPVDTLYITPAEARLAAEQEVMGYSREETP